MEPHWHPIRFVCDQCGRPATLLQVSASAAGILEFSGICVLCGREQDQAMSLAGIIGACAVKDAEEPVKFTLEDYVPAGPPN